MCPAGHHLATLSDVSVGVRKQPERALPEAGQLRRLQECGLHPPRDAHFPADGLSVHVAFAETPNEQGQPHHAVLPGDQHPAGSVQLLLDALDALAVAHLVHGRHRKGHQGLSGRGGARSGAGLSRTNAADQVVPVDHRRNVGTFVNIRCFLLNV
uniref:(northern house mosquito) hypothetical protein n=1 Tax=Culex pipiens TaxID=7175 RepID=A0A8D8C8J6_CULPI